MTPIDRNALLTGANKGIGLEIARQLAQAGVAASHSSNLRPPPSVRRNGGN